jgi:hypothetical protein
MGRLISGAPAFDAEFAPGFGHRNRKLRRFISHLLALQLTQTGRIPPVHD